MPLLQRFFLGFLLGLGSILALFIALFYRQLGAPTESSRWCYEINAQKRHQAEAIPSPRLLLVGGSSTLFGLSARQIREQTGYPTVNLGTHAGLGAQYILSLAQTIAKSGDTILLGFEYELYDYPAAVTVKGWSDSLFLDYVFARDPAFFRRLPLSRRWSFGMLLSYERLQEGLRSRRHAPRRVESVIYNVTNLNAFGDQVGHPAANRPPGSPYRDQCSAPLARGLSAQPQGFCDLRLFIQWAKQNKIRVLATFPSISHRSEYDLAPAQQTGRDLQRFFESEGVQVLGDAREAMLPPDQFFDTMYHPTDDGQQERTRRLLVHLAPLLSELDKPAQD
jgi:hypothetical protein